MKIDEKMEFNYFELLKESYQLFRKNLSLLWAYLLVAYLGNFIIQIGNFLFQICLWIGVGFFASSRGSAALIIPGFVVILLGFLIMLAFTLAYTVVLVSGRSYMIKDVLETGSTKFTQFFYGIKFLWKKITKATLTTWLIYILYYLFGSILISPFGILAWFFRNNKITLAIFTSLGVFIFVIWFFALTIVLVLFLQMFIPSVVLEDKKIIEGLKSSLFFARKNFIFLFVLWGIFLAVASIVIMALINLGLLITLHNFLIIYAGSLVGLIISVLAGTAKVGGFLGFSIFLGIILIIVLFIFYVIFIFVLGLINSAISVYYNLVLFLAYKKKQQLNTN